VRIIAGRWGGRRLPAVRETGVRPTTDRVREALMSALGARGLIEGANVLDLFCGSGALGLEALSRGATGARFVDKQRSLLRTITDFSRELDPDISVETQSLDLLSNPAKAASAIAAQTRLELGYSLVFADPPYADLAKLPSLLAALRTQGLLAPESAVIVEHSSRDAAIEVSGFRSLATYQYGDTGVILFENENEAYS